MDVLQKKEIAISFKQYDDKRKYTQKFNYIGYNNVLKSHILKPIITNENLKVEPGLIYWAKSNVYTLSDGTIMPIISFYCQRGIEMIKNLNSFKLKEESFNIILNIIISMAKKDGIKGNLKTIIGANELLRFFNEKKAAAKLVFEQNVSDLPF